MKKRTKKLDLSAETIRTLEVAALASIQGGMRSGEDCTITSGTTFKSKIVCQIG